ncbi:MAG TPA: divalent metal cation transporter [Thermoanaerobaculia bacterium]|nr:divalent metal cation transporter [Thermoanaerobaculia bacterium]
MRRLLAVLLWSVIAAAFIGPGTVTTCAAAGVDHELALVWALVFSTFATFVLQEAAARLTVVSGRDLARALSHRGGGTGRLAGVVLVVLAILLGCAAYEAGNVVGAVTGAALALPLPLPALTCGVVAAAALLLWIGSPATIARALAGFVALMGIAFLVTAALLAPPAGELLAGALVPRIPPGAGLLVLGLVGTTVVPYNLFLGSGVAAGQVLSEARFGLAVSIGLGGLISMGIVVVGSALDGAFSYPALAAVLAERLGGWAAPLFAAGLFAAGLSSAVTAPLAAAITAAGLFGDPDRPGRWAPRSWRFRAVWMAVLATGLGFGLAGLRPVPVILLAQAANGVLLPWVAIFLLLAVNDRRLMGEAGLNGWVSNLAMAAVVAVALVLGTSGVLRAAVAAAGRPALDEATLVAAAAALALLLAVPVVRRLKTLR